MRLSVSPANILVWWKTFSLFLFFYFSIFFFVRSIDNYQYVLWQKSSLNFDKDRYGCSVVLGLSKVQF